MQRRTVDYLLDQATCAGNVSTKPMFGDYGV
jgi:TfoX/Sxy family transcriptional regulator of competence genes